MRAYYRVRSAFVEFQPFLLGLAVATLVVTLTIVVLSLQQQRDTLKNIVAAQQEETADRDRRSQRSLEAARKLLVEANTAHDETARAEHQQLVNDVARLLARPTQEVVPVPVPVPAPRTTTSGSIRRETQSAVPAAPTSTTTTTVCEKGKCRGRGH